MNFNTDNAEKKLDGVKKKARKVARSTKAKVIAILTGVVILDILLFAAFYVVSKWYRSHDVFFRTPVVVQSPIVIKEKKPEIIIKKILVTPIPTPDLQTEKTEKDLILAQKHGESLWKIYQLETQRGKTDHCRVTGEGFGGFGVMNDGKIICYDTFAKSVERAEYWFNSFNPDTNLVDALCTWNLGHNVVDLKVVPHQNCTYYQDFMKVND